MWRLFKGIQFLKFLDVIFKPYIYTFTEIKKNIFLIEVDK